MKFSLVTLCARRVRFRRAFHSPLLFVLSALWVILCHVVVLTKIVHTFPVSNDTTSDTSPQMFLRILHLVIHPGFRLTFPHVSQKEVRGKNDVSSVDGLVGRAFRPYINQQYSLSANGLKNRVLARIFLARGGRQACLPLAECSAWAGGGVNNSANFQLII